MAGRRTAIIDAGLLSNRRSCSQRDKIRLAKLLYFVLLSILVLAEAAVVLNDGTKVFFFRTYPGPISCATMSCRA